MGIRDRPTAPRSPWQNGHAERLIGSIRRECLDHILVLGERHLRHVLRSYTEYYNVARTDLSQSRTLRYPEPSMQSEELYPCRSSADGITIMPGSDFRQGQRPYCGEPIREKVCNPSEQKLHCNSHQEKSENACYRIHTRSPD